MKMRRRNHLTYELVNRRTANTLAVYESKNAAVSAYKSYLASDPDFRFDLRLIAFDDNGSVVDVPLAEAAEATKASAHLVG